MAEKFASEGKFAASAVLFSKAAEAGADPVEVEVARAGMLRDAGYRFLDNSLFARAQERLEKALERDPDHFEARFQLGVLLYEGGKFKEALATFSPLAEMPEAGERPLVGLYLRNTKWYLQASEPGEEEDESQPEALRCALCWSPLEESHWTLEDGRTLCETCFSDGVNDDEVAQELLTKVTQALKDSLGIELRRPPTAHLVSGEEMARLASENLESFEGVTADKLAGLYSPGEKGPVVYILRGLPRFTSIETIAHELTHVWEGENCPPDTPLGVREGFSEYAAHRVLLELQHEEPAGRMFLSRGSYGIHFKRLEVLGRINGGRKLAELLKEGLP
jgi:hypothetical protein